MKVPRLDEGRYERSGILPTIEEELSFQVDSSRKKKLDTIQFQKLDFVKRFDSSINRSSFGSLRMKPMLKVNS